MRKKHSLMICMAISSLSMAPSFLGAAASQEEERSIARPHTLNDALQRYLANSSWCGFEPVIAFGEGASYPNFDDTVFRVDISEAVQPDAILDIRNLAALAALPERSFAKVYLANLPTAVFNSAGKVKSSKIVGELARILRVGGQLRFNDMWGLMDADTTKESILPNIANSVVAAEMALLSAQEFCETMQNFGHLNVFNHYMGKEDREKLTPQELRDAYTAYLDRFFETLGLERIEQQGDAPLGFYYFYQKKGSLL